MAELKKNICLSNWQQFIYYSDIVTLDGTISANFSSVNTNRGSLGNISTPFIYKTKQNKKINTNINDKYNSSKIIHIQLLRVSFSDLIEIKCFITNKDQL